MSKRIWFVLPRQLGYHCNSTFNVSYMRNVGDVVEKGEQIGIATLPDHSLSLPLIAETAGRLEHVRYADVRFSSPVFAILTI